MKFDMHLNEKPFTRIKEGKKDIELRIYDDKRRKISKGDEIDFANRETGQVITTEVIDLHVFNNFEELFDKFDKVRLGYYEDENASASDMLKYYSTEEVEKYGVVGIEVKMK